MIDPVSLSGMILTAVVISSLAGLHASRVVVPRVGKWSKAPPVYVSKAAPVSIEVVVEAAQWWRERGFEIGVVELTDRVRGPIDGGIFVGPRDEVWESDIAGRAEWLLDYPMGEDELDRLDDEHVTYAQDVLLTVEGSIKHAVISLDELQPEWNHLDIMLHEFGHALGFLHCETALFGRRKKTSKSGKRKAGDARFRVVGRKSGHVMHPFLSGMGTGKNSTKGMTP